MPELPGIVGILTLVAMIYFSVRAGQNIRSDVKEPFIEHSFRGGVFRGLDLYTERGLYYARRARQCFVAAIVCMLVWLFW